MKNWDILQEIRRKVLASEYWRVRLFCNIRGYRLSDLKLSAQKTYKTENGIQAKIEQMQVWSLSLPYLVYGHPIITDTENERVVLERFLELAKREGASNKR